MEKKGNNNRRPLGGQDEIAPKANDASPTPAKPSHIVGIGASAGGLEAIEQFFKAMPQDSGLSFVIVQHLDPSHHSSMPEIMARLTKMPVHVAAEGVRLAANSVYLNPPDKYLGV